MIWHSGPLIYAWKSSLPFCCAKTVQTTPNLWSSAKTVTWNNPPPLHPITGWLCGIYWQCDFLFTNHIGRYFANLMHSPSWLHFVSLPLASSLFILWLWYRQLEWSNKTSCLWYFEHEEEDIQRRWAVINVARNEVHQFRTIRMKMFVWRWGGNRVSR